MSTQLDSDSLTEAACAIVRAYYHGTRQELDATAEAEAARRTMSDWLRLLAEQEIERQDRREDRRV